MLIDMEKFVVRLECEFQRILQLHGIKECDSISRMRLSQLSEEMLEVAERLLLKGDDKKTIVISNKEGCNFITSHLSNPRIVKRNFVNEKEYLDNTAEYDDYNDLLYLGSYELKEQVIATAVYRGKNVTDIYEEALLQNIPLNFSWYVLGSGSFWQKTLTIIAYWAQFSGTMRKIALKLSEMRRVPFVWNGYSWDINSDVEEYIPSVRILVERKHIERGETRYITHAYHRLIHYFLYQRDIISLFQAIDSYEAYDVEEAKTYVAIKKEIEKLFEKVKKVQDNNTNRNIIMNWTDNVSLERIEDMPFLKSRMQKGVYFKDTFTSFPWTSWVTRIIFSGDSAITGRLFLKHRIDDKWKLVRILQNEGYEFKYAGRRIQASKMFKKKYRLYNAEIDEVRTASRSQWYALDFLLSAGDKKRFVLVHSIRETHPDYISVDNQYVAFKGKNATNEQKTIAARYLDQQLEWWDNYYGSEAVRIYMSDHGDSLLNTDKGLVRPNDYIDERTHVFTMVVGKGVEPKIVEGFFQYERFADMIELLIRDSLTDVKRLLSQYAFYEVYDRYSAGKVTSILERRESGQCISADYWMQFRGVRTVSEKYIRFVDGRTRYYLLPNEEEKQDKSQDSSYFERIAYLDAMLASEYIDIYKYRFFKWPRKLYNKSNYYKNGSRFI